MPGTPASGREIAHADRALREAMVLSRERRWIRVRLAGWVLIGLWQAIGLVSEFWPIDLESRVLRITGRVVGLAGLVLIAYGFERLVKLAHLKASTHERLTDEAATSRRQGRGPTRGSPPPI